MVSNDTFGKDRRSVRIPKALSSQEAIDTARKALKKRGRFLFYNAGKLDAQFMELGLLTTDEKESALDDALLQITPADRLGPQSPNDVSAHPYGGNVLYAFVWKSRNLGDVYLKFCFSGTPGLELLVLHSFHKSVPLGEVQP